MITMCRYVVVSIVGVSSGMVVASALFSVLVALGAVNKTASILGRADSIKFLEWMVSTGAIIFNIIYLFTDKLYGGYLLLIILGCFFGIFIGIMLMALAEETRVIPILYRRVNLTRGFIYIAIATAFGKICGCLFDLL